MSSSTLTSLPEPHRKTGAWLPECLWLPFFCLCAFRLLHYYCSVQQACPLGYLGQRWYGLDELRSELLFQWTAAPFLAASVALFTVWHINRWQDELNAAKSKISELGSYDLVKKLGQGGMGEVWQARHKLLACPAAVKLIRTPTPDLEATLKHLFEQEAQVTASSAHFILCAYLILDEPMMVPFIMLWNYSLG